ncbi:hypothetical protein AB8989_03840 [Yersinia hibernica]|uniref:Fatty acid desaturase n=1 Tax=Yersinia hibernica TaxID=2339259 RepID=A0ABX5QW91_9GAMM|nr:hypothetical protein [Yersinia hibernica]QAX77429.1 hypothetical protein D5F51_01940 [Yersinia hibernica]
MNTSIINTEKPNDKIRIREVRKAIINHCKEVKEKYSILKYQDALGFGILSTMISVISSLCYINGYIAWWVCIIINALCISLAHEIEHDLLHSLYFKKHRIMQYIIL